MEGEASRDSERGRTRGVVEKPEVWPKNGERMKSEMTEKCPRRELRHVCINPAMIFSFISY